MRRMRMRGYRGGVSWWVILNSSLGWSGIASALRQALCCRTNQTRVGQG